MKKIIVYAVAEKGEGRAMEIGQYEDISDIEIFVGMLDRDVVLRFEEHEESKKE